MFNQPPKNNNDNNKEPAKSFEDRRLHKRIQKNFVMSYFEKLNPEVRYDITQLKNISMGGICFISNKPFTTGTVICVELKTPYLSDITHIEGTVLDSIEKARNLLYETRLKFTALDPQAEYLMNKLIEFFINGEQKNYE